MCLKVRIFNINKVWHAYTIRFISVCGLDNTFCNIPLKRNAFKHYKIKTSKQWQHFSSRMGPSIQHRSLSENLSSMKMWKRIRKSSIQWFTSLSQNRCIHAGKRSQIALVWNIWGQANIQQNHIHIRQSFTPKCICSSLWKEKKSMKGAILVCWG